MMTHLLLVMSFPVSDSLFQYWSISKFLLTVSVSEANFRNWPISLKRSSLTLMQIYSPLPELLTHLELVRTLYQATGLITLGSWLNKRNALKGCCPIIVKICSKVIYVLQPLYRSGWKLYFLYDFMGTILHTLLNYNVLIFQKKLNVIS